MKALVIDFLEWQKRFGTEETCGEALARQRWPEGFHCPRCGHDHGYTIRTRNSYECSSCHYQAPLTAGTLFHSTNLPLTKWFWAIYLMASDKRRQNITCEMAPGGRKRGVRQFQRRRKEQCFCTIDPADGTMQKCFIKGLHPFGFGLHEVGRRPITGQTLSGLQPPMWQDIVKLCKKAALAFLPSKCLSWDIAMTSAGPVLIEANRYWDRHNEDMGMRRVLHYRWAERDKVDS